MSVDLFGAVSSLDTGARSENDFYPTPEWATRTLLHFHGALRGARVLECASGRDDITRVLRAEGRCTVITNDIDPRHAAQWQRDARQSEFWHDVTQQEGSIEWVVSNFPFDVAFEILTHAVQHATVGVAVLLRKTFLEPTLDRGAWLAAHPPTRVIGLPRHKFRAGADTSDSVSCDWMLWERAPQAGLAPFVIDHAAKTRTAPIVRRLP